MASFTGESRAGQESIPAAEAFGSESRNFSIYLVDLVRFFASVVMLTKQPSFESRDFLISSSAEEILSQS